MKQSLAKALLSFCSLLAFAGCVTTMPPEQSPVMLDIPSLASASREAGFSKSDLAGTYDAELRYRSPETGRTLALLRLHVFRSGDIPKTHVLDAARNAALARDGSSDAGFFLRSCASFLIGHQSHPYSSLYDEIDGAHLDKNELREDMVVRDYGESGMNHNNHARTATVRDGDRECIGFSQCLPHSLTPEGWNLADVSGFYCLPAGETVRDSDPRRVVDAIVIRPEQVPRP